jgi:pimeloyl-ACP methyl ester carboxylesterase
MTTGWNQIFIEDKLFCNHYFSGKDALNIIVTHTPIMPATFVQSTIEPLTEHPVNIFSFDFSSTGNSKGKDFSLETIVSDLHMVIDYIEKNYSTNIHLLGYTGIGGIMAQYAVHAGIDARIKSFAQYGNVIHKDLSPMRMTTWMGKINYYMAKPFPNFTKTFFVFPFKGFNAEKDNAFYKEMKRLVPGAMKIKLSLSSTLLAPAIFDDSIMQNAIKSPTLVFQTMHDRYFPVEYFQKYYDGLSCEKKLVKINDAHNSYSWSPELYCEPAYDWFVKHSE